MSDRILLIDDDPRLIAALQIRLEAFGYAVHVAHDGQEGLSAATQFLPRVIILDVNMPGMSGIEVCRQVRAISELSGTQIIVMSAVTHDNARRAAVEAGADMFLGKPYQSTQVIAAIRAAIEHPRAIDGCAARG